MLSAAGTGDDHGSSPPTADGTGDAEAGNVVLAVLALMMVVLFTGLAFATATHSLTLGADDGDLARSGAATELGVNEAFARIDGGQAVAFTGTGDIDGTRYRYEARPAGPSSWTVTAQASSGTVTRATQATIARQALYPHTLFVDDELVLDRNTGTVEGRVGTNGTMTITGPSPGEAQELYRPDGACTGCVDPVVLDGPRRLDPVGAPAGPLAACPVDGRFEGAVDGGGGTVIVCDDPVLPVLFVDEVTVDNPPLVVHVGRDVPLSLDGATVNAAGPASSFRLHVDGDPSDTVTTVSATGAAITGLLYAPERSLTTADTTLIGSATLARIELVRNGRLDVRIDPTIGPLGSDDWRILDLRPVAPTP